MNKMCAISSAISFLISVDMDGERPRHLYQLGLSPFSQAGLDESGPSRRPGRSYRDKQRVRTPLSGAAAANSSSGSLIGTWPRIASGFTSNCSAGHRLKQQPRVVSLRSRPKPDRIGRCLPPVRGRLSLTAAGFLAGPPSMSNPNWNLPPPYRLDLELALAGGYRTLTVFCGSNSRLRLPGFGFR
jgi:hypothetical protein